jgi:tripartite ATP-independent transporter DctP family solute receptor
MFDLGRNGMMVSRNFLIGSAAAVAMSLSAVGGASALVIKASDVHPADYPTMVGIAKMGELLETWTNGRITMELYPSMQLGGEKEALEQTQVGAVELARVSVGVVGPIVEEFNAFNLPYIFRSVEHMHHVVDGEIGQELLQKLDAGDLIGLGYMDGGARSFFTDKPINKPEDLAGYKFRVMGNPIFVEMMDALGSTGVPIAYNELYTALQTGVVDGAENNPPSLWTERFYEISKVYSLDEHLIVPEIFVFSKKVWDTLSPVDQQLIRNASVIAVQVEREAWKKKEESAMADLEAAGVTIIRDVDKQPFIDATEPLRQKYGEKWTDLMAAIQATE